VRWAWLFLAACNYSPSSAERPGDAPLAVPDAFAPATQCPATYALVLPNQTSRYRVIRGDGTAWDHSDDCNDDLPGATHLVAIDNQAELDQVEAALTAIGDLEDNRAWIGAVQLRGQAEPGIGWLSITGGPLDLALWDQGEPNDVGGDEDDQENFGSVERNRDGLYDFTTDDTTGGMCECDGKPIDPAAAAAIDANRS
jgi:hypothetical protein